MPRFMYSQRASARIFEKKLNMSDRANIYCCVKALDEIIVYLNATFCLVIEIPDDVDR